MMLKNHNQLVAEVAVLDFTRVYDELKQKVYDECSNRNKCLEKCSENKKCGDKGKIFIHWMRMACCN